MPKVNSLVEKINNHDISLALLTEVWQKAENKKHIFKIEKMLHMEGLKYISTPRNSAKRGGGAAIVASVDKYSLDKIEIVIPHNLEIVYGLLRPKVVKKGEISEFICVAFYYPPRGRKQAKLIDHLMTTIHMLLTRHPRAGLIIGEDKNDLNISTLIDGIPGVRQIVTQNTHKNKILDIIVTNLHKYYRVPIITPPVERSRAGGFFCSLYILGFFFI